MPATADPSLLPGEELLKILDVEWDFHGGDDDPDFIYLQSFATFEHKEACEYILHVGTDPRPEFYRNKLREMREEGCSREFRAAYLRARKLGAVRINFWS